MVGTKYIDQKNAENPLFTYGQMNINELSAADKQEVMSSSRFNVDSAGNVSVKDADGSLQAITSTKPKVNTELVDQSALKELADLVYLAQNTGVSSKKINAAAQAVGLKDYSANFMDVKKLLEANGYNPGSNTDFYGNNTPQDAGAKILSERWQQAPKGEGKEPVNDSLANAAYLEKQLAGTGVQTDATLASSYAGRVPNLQQKLASVQQQSYEQADAATGNKHLNIFQWGQEEEEEPLTGGTIRQPARGRPAPAPTQDTTQAQPATFDYGTQPRTITTTPQASIYQTPTQTAFPNASTTGTFSQPLETANLSAIPQNVTYKTSYTGTSGNVPSALMAPTGQSVTEYEQMREEGTTGVRVVNYVNQFGSTIPVTEINGVPMTAVPAGYVRQSETVTGTATVGAAEGGMMKSQSMFSPQQSATILNKMFGYNGPADSRSIQQFLAANPAAAARMGKYQETMKKMASGRQMNTGGMVSGYSNGGLTIKKLPDEGLFGLDFYAVLDANGNEVNRFSNRESAQDFLNSYSSYQAPVFEEFIPEGGKPEDAQNWAVGFTPEYFRQYYGQEPTQEQIVDGRAIARFSSFEEAQKRAQQAYQQSQQQPFEDVFAKQQAMQLGQQNLLGQAAQPMRQAVVSPLVATSGQFIPSDAGQTVDQAPYSEVATVGSVEQAQMPMLTDSQMLEIARQEGQKALEAGTSPEEARNIAERRYNELKSTQVTTAQMAPATSLAGAQEIAAQTQAATGQLTSQIEAQRADESAVSQLEAATGTAVMMNNPVTREIQNGELISGSAVDATKVAELNAMTQAATATPSDKATVAGQLEGLMQQFEGGQTPSWAAGAMRNAQATLAARGVGASSMAGQAIIQAAMESALPIAQADAATRAQFESQNLSNRQQAAMLAAQQRAQFLQIEFDQEFQSRVQNAARISDIANMNFTAEQQIALENARAANTINLQNLSNTQAMVMAEAAALSQLDMANLNNRQQAAVQNAQNFLQMDMANLNNLQQTEIFKSQQMMQALFTDQAAENAAAQFNATSQNQVNQFFAQLQSQTAQFNAAQTNALNQFNAGEANALREFNSTIQQQRDMFNAQNGLVIAQANAQWRQNIDTLNTAAQNEANMEFARTLNAMSAGTLDQMWQRERDLMSFVFTASESEAERNMNIFLADKELAAYREKIDSDESTAKWAVFAKLAGIGG